MKGMDRVSKEQLFPLVEGSIARGNSFTVRGRRFGEDLRKTFSPSGWWESGMRSPGR